MTWRRSVYSVLATIALAWSASTAAADPAVITEYAIRYGPLTVVSLRATTELGASRYRTTTEMETVGLVGFLFPWRAWTTTEGQRTADGLQPLVHRSSGEYRGDRRAVLIDYSASGGVVSTVQPAAAADARDTVPIALQQQTVDPLTATLSVLTSECRGSVRVFDGRRRYDVQLSDLGAAEVPESWDTMYSGPARRCRSEVKPLAGFWQNEPRHDERPTHLDYWIASPRPDLLPVPVYLELSGARGTLSIHLLSVTDASAKAE